MKPPRQTSSASVDVHITVEGAKQAEALANKIKDVPIDRIFVSELGVHSRQQR